ncbi:hypothetical protein [Oryza sativa Japonica Group]|uniref:Uncharacterized protein n=1 Tax=Oryza sativa subsp. japonica TaxID=39947 RepID=Q5VR31_ORYSJ|nr:hypothetical protein [Oryza sativa Japonica Group]
MPLSPWSELNGGVGSGALGPPLTTEIPSAGGSFSYLHVELSDIAVFLATGNIPLEAVVGAVRAVAWLLLAAYLQFTFGWRREEWFPAPLQLWWSRRRLRVECLAGEERREKGGRERGREERKRKMKRGNSVMMFNKVGPF